MEYKVTVNIDQHGTVVCVPDELKLERSKGSVNIHWIVESDQDWEITAITDLENNPLDIYEFKASRKLGKTGWKIKDRNRKIRDFPYMVHIQRMKSGECKKHDPIIRNGGRM